jgi:hypothetical protein
MPGEAAAAPAEIGDTAREALTEMRRLLGVLRPTRAPSCAPAGLDRSDELCARRAPGVRRCG